MVGLLVGCGGVGVFVVWGFVGGGDLSEGLLGCFGYYGGFVFFNGLMLCFVLLFVVCCLL